MTKQEIDEVIDSYTNPILFKMDGNGFVKDSEGNLIKNFEVN
jgi:hypothetical protein